MLSNHVRIAFTGGQDAEFRTGFQTQSIQRAIPEIHSSESPERISNASLPFADDEEHTASHAALVSMQPGVAAWSNIVPAGLQDQQLYSNTFVEDLQLLSPVHSDASHLATRLGDNASSPKCSATWFEAEAEMPSGHGHPAGPAGTTVTEIAEISDGLYK